ncbi:MAG: hypothetical protein H0W53_22775 [Acidobacteria bacterium]|nr:hypothetical protein [Acidobacteriota bacterium]
MSHDDDQAAIFGRRWIAANIDPGPHSVNDGPIVQTIVDQFVAEAEEAGLSQEQLERSLGDIRVFLQSAFDDAHRAWKSEIRL